MSNLQLKFFGPDGRDDHAVRADTLVTALAGIQRVLKIMGELADPPTKKRQGSRQRQPCALFCSQPKQGCYDIALGFRPLASQKNGKIHRHALDNFASLIASVEEGRVEKFSGKFTDGSKIVKALGIMAGISSVCAERGSIILLHGHDREFDFHKNKENLRKAKAVVKNCMQDEGNHGSKNMILAKLKSIDIEGLILSFNHSSRNIPLEFSYAGASPSLMKSINGILKSRNNLLEIHGDIQLTKSGYARRIKEISSLKEIKFNKIVVNEVKTNYGAIRPNKPLVFHPKLDDTGTIFVVDAKPFGDTIFEDTIEYLIEEINGYLSFLWEFYAMEDDCSLSDGGLQLKAAMLESFKLDGARDDSYENRNGSSHKGTHEKRRVASPKAFLSPQGL